MTSLLNWLERTLRTDVRYLISGSSWLLINQAIAFVFSFGLLWLFANTLSREVYGEYRFITTVASILALSALPGMALSLTRSVSRGNLGTLQLVIRERIRWGLFGSVLGLLGSGYYFLQADTRLGLLFLLIAVAVPFLETYASYTHYLNGLKDFRHYAYARIIQRAVVVTTTAAAVLLSGNILLIVGGFFLSTILADRILLLYATRLHPTNDAIEESAVPYGKHLSVMSAIRLGSQYLDKVALWYFTGPAQVAIYAVAMAIPQELVTGTAQIGKLALPKMSNRSKEELQHALLRKTLIYLLAVTPLVAAYVIIAPALFDTFFPQYVESIVFSQVAAAMIFFTPSGLLLQYFIATENKRVQYTLSVIEPIVQIGLYVVLIPLIGIMGAVLAVLAKHATIFGLLILFFVREKLRAHI